MHIQHRTYVHTPKKSEIRDRATCCVWQLPKLHYHNSLHENCFYNVYSVYPYKKVNCRGLQDIISGCKGHWLAMALTYGPVLCQLKSHGGIHRESAEMTNMEGRYGLRAID